MEATTTKQSEGERSPNILVPTTNEKKPRILRNISQSSSTVTNYAISSSEQGKMSDDESSSLIMEELDASQSATNDYKVMHGQPLVRGDEAATTPHSDSPNSTHSFQNYSSGLYHSHKTEQLDSDVQQAIDQAALLYHALAYNLMITRLDNVKLGPNVSYRYTEAVSFGLGLAHFKLDEYDLATSHFLKAYNTALEHSDYGSCSIIEYYLAEIDYTQNKFLPSAEYYEKAILHHDDNSIGKLFDIEVPTLSMLYCKQGTALRYGSKLMEAVKKYGQAVQTAVSKNDQLTAHTNLGNLYQAIGDFTRSVEEYEHTIRLGEELDDQMSLGWAHGNIGNAYLGLSKKDKALEHLNLALDITMEQEPTPLAIGRALNNLGTSFQALGNNDQAKSFYDQSLSQAVYGCDQPGQARVFGNLGNILMMQEKYSEAIAHYTETLSISRDRATQTTAYHNRGCARYERAESERKKEPSGESNITYLGIECTPEHEHVKLPDPILKYYRSAKSDLERVTKTHEQTLNNIKGSPNGLSLSVSLFETNARTFQRLQDSSYCLGQWKQALVFAEQSRARTLGELLLKKKTSQLVDSYHTPLDIPQIAHIIKTFQLPVVYMSFTSNRLLVWLLLAGSDAESDISISMFQVYINQNEFDDKSFDFVVRYQLTEKLCDMVNMYKPCDYNKDTILNKLYGLIATPLIQLLTKVCPSKPLPEEVIVIPDSYTRLLPVSALQDPQTHSFLGDTMRFHIMNSLLTTAILYQLPTAKVTFPLRKEECCVVGNPFTPHFKWKGEHWKLGRLPFSEEEAHRVSFTLGVSAITGYQASKEVVLSMIKHSKIIHLATHGCASGGFLVFAGTDGANARSLLLFFEDIENITTPGALVVLSSCDSGRGTFKADGIQGIARSFLLAGAQTILTSLWRVPDESACYFMHFFYQYLVDGFPSYTALQKACLSIRCYKKYGEYIHWSGYQLQGREICFVSEEDGCHDTLPPALGKRSEFTDLELISQLSQELIHEQKQEFPLLSHKVLVVKKDVQLLIGSSATCPIEVLVDYIHTHSSYYIGGIFWMAGHTDDHLTACLQDINEKLCETSTSKPSDVQQFLKTLAKVFSSLTGPVLLVLHHFHSIPTNILPIVKLIDNPFVSVIITAPLAVTTKPLISVIDKELSRGCKEHQLMPVPFHLMMQKMVYFIMSKYDFHPMNREQDLLDRIQDMLCGNLAISKLCFTCLDRFIQQREGNVTNGLESFNNEVIHPCKIHLQSLKDCSSNKTGKAFVETKQETIDNDSSVQVSESSTDMLFLLKTRSVKDLNALPSPSVLVFACQLISCLPCSPLTRLLMYSLSILNSAPFRSNILDCLVTNILKHNPETESMDLVSVLKKYHVIVPYPPPVIKLPIGVKNRQGDVALLYYIMPKAITETIYLSLTPTDKVAACAILNLTLNEIQSRRYEAAFNIQVDGSGEDFDALSVHAVGLKHVLLDYLVGEWSLFKRDVIEKVIKQYIADKVDTVGDYGVLQLINYFTKS